MKELRHQELTRAILRAFYKVYSTLGYGFLEKVYKNALILELRKSALEVAVEQQIRIHYRGVGIGDYFADIIVARAVIVEVKACEAIADAHETQLLNYLMATNIEVGLLLNFGPQPRFKRKILTHDRKKRNP